MNSQFQKLQVYNNQPIGYVHGTQFDGLVNVTRFCASNYSNQNLIVAWEKISANQKSFENIGCSVKKACRQITCSHIWFSVLAIFSGPCSKMATAEESKKFAERSPAHGTFIFSTHSSPSPSFYCLFTKGGNHHLNCAQWNSCASSHECTSLPQPLKWVTAFFMNFQL